MPNPKHLLCKKIVTKFVQPPVHWAKEIKIAKKLVEEFPDESFWERLPTLDFIYCLAYFLTSDGRKFLFDGKQRQTLEVSKPVPNQLEDKKVGDDKDFKPNKQTLLDFIRK